MDKISDDDVSRRCISRRRLSFCHIAHLSLFWLSWDAEGDGLFNELEVGFFYDYFTSQSAEEIEIGNVNLDLKSLLNINMPKKYP